MLTVLNLASGDISSSVWVQSRSINIEYLNSIKYLIISEFALNRTIIKYNHLSKSIITYQLTPQQNGAQRRPQSSNQPW